MKEFYFIVSPVEKHREKEIRVFRVEKGRMQQGNYQEAEKQVEHYASTQKKQTSVISEECVSKEADRTHTYSSLLTQMEMMKGRNVSIEERQEQLAYQKKAQESRMRKHQMAMAYGRE